MRARLGALALAAAAVPFAVLAPVTGAHADQGPGTTEPGGYSVSVQVRFSGNAAPGGGGGSTIAVNLHPVCWWEPAAGPYSDAKAMLDWYDEVTGGAQGPGMIRQYGPRSVWLAAVEREEAGQDVSWYKAYCKDPADYPDYGLGGWDGGADFPILGDGTTGEVFLYRAFGAGEAIPAPLVTPEELAQAARDNMEIPDPEIDRNPRVHDTDDATLVGLPTFFWVTDPDSVGGTAGTRSIRAEVVGGDVWAEVTATTGGLGLSWPGGSKQCAPAIAIKPYTQGMSEAGACTVEFAKASTGYPGGYPVEASTAWAAAWVGSDGTTGGLAGLTNAVTVNIPVAEVQNIVEP
ncbi:hypothetical protein [Kineosporia succinea]|uniref:Enoyl reductase n=1 Tax=Kineosporia succinea TaxID=84632 RepID=A0ABT9P4T2_9ACTN|nr:hypothetical protein [Kineosporia succinea]MDP9827704.1 hypothetical protein [Kineosporia succinea]